MNTDITLSLNTKTTTPELTKFIDYFAPDAPDLPPTEFVIEGPIWLPKSHVSLFYGEGKLGKSKVLSSMTVCVACGLDFLGSKSHAGKVLVVDFESLPNAGVHDLKRAAKGHGINPQVLSGRVFYHSYLAEGKLFKPVIEEVKDLIDLHGISLVIMDAFQSAFGISQNDDDKVAECMRMIQEVARMGVAVLVIDHVSKVINPIDPTPIGSVYKTNMSRSTHYLKKGNQLKWVVQRHNFAESGAELPIRRTITDEIIKHDLDPRMIFETDHLNDDPETSLQEIEASALKIIRNHPDGISKTQVHKTLAGKKWGTAEAIKKKLNWQQLEDLALIYTEGRGRGSKVYPQKQGD